MSSESFTVLSFDKNGINSTQESIPNKESNNSSDDFSVNKKMAQNVVFHVHMALEEAFKQGSHD